MMTFPTIAAGTRANEAIGGYANFVAYCNALAAGVDSVTTTAAGAALKANNLSDLASAATARQNLDLGDAATRDVGTGAGTVAAGDDARFSDARTPTDGSVSTVKIVDGAVTPIKVGSRYVAKTSAYTLTAADEVVDCTSGTFTVTLPSAAGVPGRMFTVKNSGTGVVTIGRTSSQTIDGVNANVVLGGKGSFTVLSTGAAWIVIQGSYTDESVGRRIFTWDQVNGRWQMTFGDTGLRDVSGVALTNGWAVYGSTAYIRRQGSAVSGLFRFNPASASSSAIGATLVAAGFRPPALHWYPVLSSSLNFTSSQYVELQSTGAILLPNYSTGVTAYSLTFSYQTAEAWPSSLPGTAVGSIPA